MQSGTGEIEMEQISNQNLERRETDLFDLIKKVKGKIIMSKKKGGGKLSVRDS